MVDAEPFAIFAFSARETQPGKWFRAEDAENAEGDLGVVEPQTLIPFCEFCAFLRLKNYPITMRRKPEDFGGMAMTRVYIASSVKEAQTAEKVLSEGGIDYFVEIEPFSAFGFIREHHIGVNLASSSSK